MFDFIVVGKGLFGSAAARHLSRISSDVAIIGPDEPTDPSHHAGVFASHYDQGRLQRHLSRDHVWAELSHRAFREYAGLTEASGITFYHPCDSVHLAPRHTDSMFIESAQATAERLGIDYTVIERGNQVNQRLPMLRFPEEVHGYIEHYPAGYINPRDLIRAQLTVAEHAGATVIRQTAVAVRDLGDRVAVTTAEGHTYEAGRVLLTVGAYTNCFDLLPRKMALKIKSETIILARVSEREVERLAGMPSMIYEIESPPIETIYMLPPIRYPDGHFYIKMGCNTPYDRYLDGAEQMGGWVREGDSDPVRDAMARVMREVIPGLEALSFETKRCLITYTPKVWPYIDRVVEDRVFLATGGNGMGAKSSDAIGRLAADLVAHGEWTDELDASHFHIELEEDRARAGMIWDRCGMARRVQTSSVPAPSNAPGPASASGPGPQVRTLADAELAPSGGIAMRSLYPWPGVVDTPFGAAWTVVEPGATSQRQMHHEAETWFIAEGRGVVSSQGGTREVGPGDVVYLPPFADHGLHNPSATQRVVFLASWWQDAELAVRHAEPPQAESQVGRVVVTVTPPTPNGDLHLGHLSGPYLGADVYARAMRMQGREAWYVTGSDDWQSYVAGKAIRSGARPEDVADHYAARITDALALADVRCDQFTRSFDPAYVARVQAIVWRLYEQGHIETREHEYLVSPTDDRHLFEFYVSGRCGHCGEPAGGGACEECGRLNEGVDLVVPAATLASGALERRTVTRLVVPLARHAETLRAHLARTQMSGHLRALAEGLLADGLPEIPVTHPHHWGIPCGVPGLEGQVVSTWFEMGHNMLEGITRLRDRHGWAASERSRLAGDDTEVVQFFGFDNGLYYSLLYPVLYQLVDPGFTPPTRLECNEFYLLDGLKFSTSRNHAVWVRDILTTEPADLVRFYLSYTRPDVERSSFTLAEYHGFVEHELVGRWQGWLRDLGARVHEHFAGRAPEPGLWTGTQRQLFADLGRVIDELRRSYQAATFSPRQATRALMLLVERAREHAAGDRHWAGVAGRGDTHRTAIALELAAARALALYAAPIMPGFAARLWTALGLPGGVEAQGFDRHLGWVPAGMLVDLGGELFVRAGRSCASEDAGAARVRAAS